MSLTATENNVMQFEISALKDLQKLLRISVDEELSVLSYTTTPLLPAGENYGSYMLKVDALIRRTKSSQNEELKLVAKTLPSLEYIRNRVKTAVTFEKEMFVYEKLAPAYRQIEEDSCIEGVSDLFPKFHGGQVMKDKNNLDKADENVVLLFENVIERGYSNMDRRQGLDLRHAKLATVELARFHAFGIALKNLKPDIFEEAKNNSSKFPFDTVDSEYQEIIDSTIKLICQDSRIAQYEDRIRALVLNSKDWKNFQEGETIEPWVTIIHGDFHANNIMFREVEGKDDDIEVKFVDFQITRISNPLFDLLFFLCASINSQVLEKHMDELMEAYFERFTEVLCKTGCDPTPFTRLSFEHQLDRFAKKLLFYSISALKFLTMDVSSDKVANEVIRGVMVDGNKLFFERTWTVVSKYVSKEWL